VISEAKAGWREQERYGDKGPAGTDAAGKVLRSRASLEVKFKICRNKRVLSLGTPWSVFKV